MTGPVALVGASFDPHIEAVKKALEDRSVDTVVVDGTRFPEDEHVSLGDAMDSITVGGHDLGHPAAFYVRDLYVHPLSIGLDVAAEMEQDWRRTLVALREKAQVLFSLMARWSELGIPGYNPASPEWKLAKPLQLALLARAGLPVPQTLWTNDPERVRAFAHGRRIAYKPVAGGAATKELGPDDLTDERLGALGGAPVTFQELLEGDNFRVYCIDGEVAAVIRITSTALDFRQNEEVIERTVLPDPVLEQCVAATEVLGLRWSGIDLRGPSPEDLRFLEVNSSPMFIGFDASAGTSVQAALVDALASHSS